MKDTKQKLSFVTITFHWLIALMFMSLIVVGKIMEGMPQGPDKFKLIGMHKSIGAIFFLIAAARVIYRIKQGFPEDLSDKPRWQKVVATSVHHLLLLATVLMPISGVAMSVGHGYGLDVFGLTVFGRGDEIAWLGDLGHVIHGAVGNLIILVIFLHAAAAIKQQFVDKTLSRMLGRTV
jgi:cytochrome b561